MPIKGESDEIPGATFEVLKASPTKIDRIAILLREPVSEVNREESSEG